MNYDVVFMKVEDLKPYEKNAKKHSEAQIDKIAESIKQFGFRQNLVVDENNCVVIGHGRLLAAKKLGLDVVPAIKVNDLSEKQIRALRLADNKVAESDWDFLIMHDELNDILNDEDDDMNIDMKLFGFDDITLGEFFEEQEKEEKPDAQDNHFNILVLCNNKEEQESVIDFLNTNKIKFEEK